MKGLTRFFSLVTFSHTIFALPFALLAAVLAAGGAPSLRTLAWILVAMAGARSAAMAFNRIVDRDIDAKNPRTRGREIPSGAISVKAASVFCALSSVVFILAASFLMIRGFDQGYLEGTGFAKDHLLMVRFDPRIVQYNADQTRHFYELLSERVIGSVDCLD